MWSHVITAVIYCPSDFIVQVIPIVSPLSVSPIYRSPLFLWPIVSLWLYCSVMLIVLVTSLFSFTISTSSLWPYSLRLDFCILRYRQAIRVPFPTLIPCPSCLKVIRSKASDCLSSYHFSSVTVKVPFILCPCTQNPRLLLLSVLVNDLTHVRWTSLPWHNIKSSLTRHRHTG